MTLRYSPGQRVTGRVCAADEAFDRLRREAAQLDSRGTWAWFADRFRSLEASLIDAGGFDENLADHLDHSGCVIVPTEVADRHFQTEDICAELEELVAAFFVTLQPRLNAVKVAARRVYDRAAKIDGLDVRKPSALTFPAALEAAWQVANYVKHCDEWEAALTPQQQRCFEALVQLGIASVAEGQRKLDRWVLVSAACALSEETTLARAVDVIVRRCKTSCDEIETAMQADFTRIATAVEAVRLGNVPRLGIRANYTLRNDDDVR